MEQSTIQEATSCADSQEPHGILWNLKLHYSMGIAWLLKAGKQLYIYKIFLDTL
jgi:hypothetical protein